MKLIKKINLIVAVLLLLSVIGFNYTYAFAIYSAGTLVSLTNSERSKNGLGSLSVNSALTAAASAKANDMLAKNYFAHTSPDGRTPWDFIHAAGYNYTYAGENLAIGYSSASELMSAWMASATHRENILNSNFREIGIAVVAGKYDGVDTIIVAQEFGATVASQPQVASEAEQNPDETNQTATPSQNNQSTPNPTTLANAAFDILTEKSSFSPESVFENEEAEIKVAVTGDIESLEGQIGDVKINLLENGQISQSGDEKLYSGKLKLAKAGTYDVTITAGGSSGSKKNETIGQIEVKPVAIVNESSQRKGLLAGFSEGIKNYWIYILVGMAVLGTGGYLLATRVKFNKLVKFGTTTWDL